MNPFEVPLADTPFRRFSSQEADQFARRTGWVDDVGIIDIENGIVQSKPIPWLGGSELISVQSPAWGDTIGAWILDVKTNKLVRLDGTSPPIHELNRQHQVQLTRDLVLPYLGFFCTFVHGEDGPFAIVNSSDDSTLPEDWPTEKYGNLIKPASLVHEEGEEYNVEATVSYSNSLFWSHFRIKSSGMSEMIDDEVKVADTGCKYPLRLKFVEEEQSEEVEADPQLH